MKFAVRPFSYPAIWVPSPCEAFFSRRSLSLFRHERWLNHETWFYKDFLEQRMRNWWWAESKWCLDRYKRAHRSVMSCKDLLINWPLGIQRSVYKDGIFLETDYKRLRFASRKLVRWILLWGRTDRFPSITLRLLVICASWCLFFCKDSRQCVLSDRNNPVQPK